jgi:hypothetical protein
MDAKELKRIAHELRAYNPAADEYKGEHIHKVWAREIEAALSDAAQAPVAWVRLLADGLYEGPVMNCDKRRMDEIVRVKPHEWTALIAVPVAADAAAPTLAVNADDLDFTPNEQHAISDMANIGKALLERIASMCPDYAWNESPTEIVSDLVNERDDARADYDRIRHGLAKWAAERWNAEVRNRPLVNVHRRALDDTWRQVIRHCGKDDVALLGPKHGDLVAADTAAPSEETSTGICFFCGEPINGKHEDDCPQAAQPDERAAFDLPPLPAPLEIDWPELHSQALGCGVEDRNIRDRYEAAEYGWQDGVDRAVERVPEEIFTADQMREYALSAVARATAPQEKE